MRKSVYPWRVACAGDSTAGCKHSVPSHSDVILAAWLFWLADVDRRKKIATVLKSAHNKVCESSLKKKKLI